MLLRIQAAALLLIVTASSETQLRFEVASVKMSPARQGAARLVAIDIDPATVRYTNLSLQILIAVAYRFDSDLIKGGPEWLDKQSYDVVARLPSTATKDRSQK